MLLPLRRVSPFRPVVVPHLWLRSSHDLLSSTKTSQKVHRARVNTLLFGADRLLLTPRADTLESYIMAKLSGAKFYNMYRPTAFTRLIRFCLERQLFDVALALHDRMVKEGFLVVHSLSLRLTALSLVRHAKNLREIISPLKQVFENKAYDVPAFMDLVHYLTDDKYTTSTLVDDLAHTFVSIRRINLGEYPDLVGLMATINMRAERLDATRAWLQVFEDECGTQGVLPEVTPYSDIISTLHDIDPKNSDAIQDVLVHMKSAGVAPDVNIFNTLMRINLVQQRYQEAFALYHVLMERRSDDLMPNDVTYKILFRATHALSRPCLARRRRRPQNIIPPRRLFQDMLACHLEQTKGQPLRRSTIVSVSVLHLALRTFMVCEDYAAAYITIHVLAAFGFEPNLQTYLIVLANLLHRMKYETNLPRLENTYLLVDFLIHLHPSEDPDLHSVLDRIRDHRAPYERQNISVIGIETISHLLTLGEHCRTTVGDLPEVSSLPRFPLRRHTRIPTAAMLIGTDQRVSFSPVPLARIVHKALLGELFRKAIHRDTGWDWKGAAGPIVEETQREMIPEGVAEGLGSEGRGCEKRGTVLPFAAARMRRRRRSARGGREIAFELDD